MFTCVMHKYDKMAYEMFSTSVYILLYFSFRFYGKIFNTLSYFYVWIWLINSALAALHGAVHSLTLYSCQSLYCHLPLGKIVMNHSLQIFYYIGSFWSQVVIGKKKKFEK